MPYELLTRQLLNAEEINFIRKVLVQDNQGWEDGKKLLTVTPQS